MSFSVLIPCGPSPRERERILDILGALERHEPDCEHVVLVVDGNPPMEEFGRSRGLTVLAGARNGAGWGVGGGLVTNQLGGYEWLLNHARRSRFVLRMDTDAAILGPFSGGIAAELAEPGVGMVGSFVDRETLAPDRRTPGIGYFAAKVRKLHHPVSLWRKPKLRLRTAASKDVRLLSADFREAGRQGYVDGMLVEGGSFALDWEWLMRAERLGLFRDKSRFCEAPVTEDVVMTMLTYRLGLKAVDSALFCIEPSGLRHPAAQMVGNAGRSPIVHSVKCASADDEAGLRRSLGLFWGFGKG